MEKIKYILLTILLLFTIDVYADTIQIEDSTTYNYYIDLRANQYFTGRTLIQEGIITTTCNFLPNSFGCGIQVPLTTPLNVVAGKKYTFSFLVSTDNRTLQVSTWKNNLVLVGPNDTNPSSGIWRMYNYDTSDITVYNADVTISLQDSNSNIKIYKIDYSFTSKFTDDVKVVTFAFGENFNGDSTTGTLQFTYFMVDATNEEIVDAVKETNKKLDELNKNITSSDVPNKNELSTKLDTTGWLKPGPVDSIINMPLNLINNLLSSLNNNTCSQLVIDIPYLKNKQLIIPCISTLYEKMGFSSLFNSIGAIASAFILFRYLVGFYKWVDDTLSFREQNWGDF